MAMKGGQKVGLKGVVSIGTGVSYVLKIWVKNLVARM
jgi:membrane carboxypeptidase/penicillin-binding protein PbpC